MKFRLKVSSAVTTFSLSLACALPAHAELQAQWIGNSGVLGYYDTTLDVTWLDMAGQPRTWDAASAWVNSLNLGGVTGWRLPTMAAPLPGAQCSNNGTHCGYNVATSSSEIASLFFDTLGNKSFVNTSGATQAGFGLSNTGGLRGLQSGIHWLSEYTPNPNLAWFFDTRNGYQYVANKNEQFYALAVHSGNVMAPVPEPETYALLLAGLAVVGTLTRRRTRTVASLAI